MLITLTHLPYPTELVSYASYGSKSRSGLDPVGEGFDNGMIEMDELAEMAPHRLCMASPSPLDDLHAQEMITPQQLPV